MRTTPSIATSNAQAIPGGSISASATSATCRSRGAGAISTWRLELPAQLRAYIRPDGQARHRIGQLVERRAGHPLAIESGEHLRTLAKTRTLSVPTGYLDPAEV
ncbi:MAG: hypothetical protein DLM58_10990 [Pseudonocardiales bacterium]|nr:MAG: hypothetical protein DLM58_10990 [Pseudonocardiales bacterium]